MRLYLSILALVFVASSGQNSYNGETWYLIPSSSSSIPVYSQVQVQQYGPPGYNPHPVIQCPPNDPQRNKEIVYKVFEEILGLRMIEKIEEYFQQDYIQHNPDVPDGLGGLRDYVKGDTSPPEPIRPIRSAADGDLVWTHNRIEFDGKTYASVDIFRFECGKIKEHWDVLQDTKLEGPAKNAHPFF